jgi:SWIM zinc finger
MNDALASVVSSAALRVLAGEPSYSRGEDYFRARRVRRLDVRPESASADVKGVRLYKVELWTQPGGRLGSSCTCPMGEQAAFCKHCVAVGLALLRDFSKGKGAAGPAQRKARGPVDVAALEKQIDRAVYTRDFIDYAHAPDYALGIHEMIDTVEELLENGHPDEVVRLAECFLSTVEEMLGMVDDADGHLGVICERLEWLHHEACVQTRPDPVALAERLFDRMLSTDLELFYDAAETYADVLGNGGLARYAELARAEWERLSRLGAGSEPYEERSFAIMHVMKLLAARDDEVRRLLAES